MEGVCFGLVFVGVREWDSAVKRSTSCVRLHSARETHIRISEEFDVRAPCRGLGSGRPI